jgi:DNA-binding response OmpR family regulator
MSAPSPSSASKTIMVVDDDKAFRTVVCDVLEAAGYRTLVAPNGLEALQINKTFHGRIDLVLIDVILPLMSGLALAEQIRKRRPVRLLMMSGQAEGIAKAVARTPGIRIIPKPLTHDGLLREVRAMLVV